MESLEGSCHGGGSPTAPGGLGKVRGQQDPDLPFASSLSSLGLVGRRREGSACTSVFLCWRLRRLQREADERRKRVAGFHPRPSAYTSSQAELEAEPRVPVGRPAWRRRRDPQDSCPPGHVPERCQHFLRRIRFRGLGLGFFSTTSHLLSSRNAPFNVLEPGNV